MKTKRLLIMTVLSLIFILHLLSGCNVSQPAVSDVDPPEDMTDVLDFDPVDTDEDEPDTPDLYADVPSASLDSASEAGYEGTLFYIDRFPGDWTDKQKPVYTDVSQIMLITDDYSYMYRRPGEAKYDPKGEEQFLMMYWTAMSVAVGINYFHT